KRCGGENRQRPAEAGSDERGRAGQPAEFAAKLGEHPRQRQGGEIGLVEIRAADVDTVLGEAFAEERDLRRLRRRREAVQVEEVHKSVWQPGRQRHLMSPSPSVW